MNDALPFDWIALRSPAGEEEIRTPGGSSITPSSEGGYRVCDRYRHCRRVPSLWEAQQLVQWSEVHHQPLQDPEDPPKAAGRKAAAAARLSPHL